MRAIIKVYGPYLYTSGCNAGRRYMNLKYDDGTKTTTLYSRWLMQEHLGRPLLPTEHVDHLDEDKTNDDIANLAITTLVENAKKSHAARPCEVWSFICPMCDGQFARPARVVRENWSRGKSGPYCGKKCSRAWQVSHQDAGRTPIISGIKFS